jgi:MYXO-CTERM domain-containing protein
MALLMGTGTTARADFMTFEVIPAFAPTGVQSPSWSNYVVNALAGIQQGMDVGDRSTSPTAYERVTSVLTPEELIYTTGNVSGQAFNSWRGIANPASPFSGEFGNRIHFGLKVVSDTEFKLDDLTWQLDSNDSDDYFDQSGNFQGASYSPTRMGIWWGADGVKGGVDDVTRSSGPGTDPVNELLYVGVGDGFLADEPAVLSDQQRIDTTIADILAGCTDPSGCLVDVTGTYSLPDGNGGTLWVSNSFVLATPEPSAGLLALIGMAALAVSRRRRK